MRLLFFFFIICFLSGRSAAAAAAPCHKKQYSHAQNDYCRLKNILEGNLHVRAVYNLTDWNP
ncbi:MAG: hypothetical protein ACK48P_03260 [Holosporales bacterium]|jgi:hypothetical protein